MIHEIKFNISTIFKITVANDYYICSEIHIDRLIERLCEKAGGEFWKAYLLARNQGFAFIDFPDQGNLNMNSYQVPRFGETDLAAVVNSLGGEKIPESEKRTPDFMLNNILLELKDLQDESLNNFERQKSIAKVFKKKSDYAINIDPAIDLGEVTYYYHRLIRNTIKNHFKTASKQIKQHKENFCVDGAGIVMLNTGLYSLPHELFKEIVTDLLNRETKTIEFALIFSQKMQTNGWSMNVVFASEWIGSVPNDVKEMKSALDKLVNQKMTEMMTKNNSSDIIESQHPISFEIDNQVFFWNPGQLKFPWEKE